LDNNDARVLYELDDLRKIALVDPKTRLMLLKPHQGIIMQRDDLVTEFITLLNICHEHDRALAILKERTFAPWEGGEGRVTGQYVNALIRKSLSLIKDKAYVLAKQALIEALEFPVNLNEGRLVGQTDNDIYYLLGLIEQKLGEESAAKQMYQRALAGESEVTESRYYNDMPADYLLFQTLAMYQLGEQERAVNKFKDMAAWVASNESQQVEHDFFAVSLPQLNVFDKDIQTNHRTHCLFVDLLAKLGLAQIQSQTSDEVNSAQHALLDSDPSHAKAHLLSYLSSVSLTELA
jgi:tetratricopeptide (TPR) repeat protein